MMLFKFEFKYVKLNFKAITSMEFSFDIKLYPLCSYGGCLFMKNCWKLSTFALLKTKNTHFLQVNFSRSYSWKMPLKHKFFFAGKLYSRNSCKSFCLNFVFSLFCLNPFSWEELSREIRTKMLFKCFQIYKVQGCVWLDYTCSQNKNL